MNNMLTLEEVKNYLEVEQAVLEKYISQGKLNAYKIGGTFVRFRKEDVLNLRYEIAPTIKTGKQKKTGIFSKIADFWRFNNFYLISILLVGAIIYYIFKG